MDLFEGTTCVVSNVNVTKLVAPVIVTFLTSVKLNSHRYPASPSFGMNTDILRCEWFEQGIGYNGISVRVATEHLSGKKPVQKCN